jgi:CRP-like cAMP-binding protein
MPTVIKARLIADETIHLLNKFKILNTLSPDEIRTLLGTAEDDYHTRIARLVRYKANEMVIREGDYDSWIFWVVQGEFHVMKDEMLVTVLKDPGDVFGEMSSMGIDSRSASVIADKDSVCVSMDMSVLDTIGSPEIIRKIESGINRLKTERLARTTGQLVEEKQKVLRQQSNIHHELQRLREKEDRLSQWEKILEEREKRLKQSV